VYRQGRSEGGQGGHAPAEIPTLKFFLTKQYRICDIQSNVQHVFRVSGDFVPDPIRGSLGTEPLFCPPSPKQIPDYAPAV